MAIFKRRTSHEVRGLKWITKAFAECFRVSHLTRGAWIEIKKSPYRIEKGSCRTSHEVRGLKSKDSLICTIPEKSHLTRGAWIEIYNISSPKLGDKIQVAPHTRCVD